MIVSTDIAKARDHTNPKEIRSKGVTARMRVDHVTIHKDTETPWN